MLAEHRRPEERQIAQPGDAARVAVGERLAGEVDADEGRQAAAEQGERQARRVLVGVEPDHEQPEQEGQHDARDGAGGEGGPVVAGVERGREAGERADQHHPFGTEVENACLLVEEQAEPGQRQRRSRGQRGCDQQRKVVHDEAALATGGDGATGVAGAAGEGRDDCQRTR